jgi:hypothetical protein
VALAMMLHEVQFKLQTKSDETHSRMSRPDRVSISRMLSKIELAESRSRLWPMNGARGIGMHNRWLAQLVIDQERRAFLREKKLKIHF